MVNRALKGSVMPALTPLWPLARMIPGASPAEVGYGLAQLLKGRPPTLTLSPNSWAV